VQSDCQTNGTSAWVGPKAFQTTLPALSGTYTINSTQPTAGTNFNSFTDFATIIGLGGLGGPVTVNVVAGTGPYTEQFMLNELAGSSSINTLTINGNGETLQFTSTNTNERATMKLNGTDFVTVNNLIIKALGTTGPSPTEYGWAVWLTNNADSMHLLTVNSMQQQHQLQQILQHLSQPIQQQAQPHPALQQAI
jgi:hypothetical protein